MGALAGSVIKPFFKKLFVIVCGNGGVADWQKRGCQSKDSFFFVGIPPGRTRFFL